MNGWRGEKKKGAGEGLSQLQRSRRFGKLVTQGRRGKNRLSFRMDTGADHDPQDGPTLTEVRRIRREVYEEDIGRTPEQWRQLDREIAAKFGLQLRKPIRADAPPREST
jgi:hypothetical protein